MTSPTRNASTIDIVEVLLEEFRERGTIIRGLRYCLFVDISRSAPTNTYSAMEESSQIRRLSLDDGTEFSLWPASACAITWL